MQNVFFSVVSSRTHTQTSLQEEILRGLILCLYIAGFRSELYTTLRTSGTVVIYKCKKSREKETCMEKNIIFFT